MNISESNYIEAGLWFSIALCLGINVFIKGRTDVYFKVLIMASFTFTAFGISDLIEAQTGAWW